MLAPQDRLASAQIATGLGVFSSQSLIDLHSRHLRCDRARRYSGNAGLAGPAGVPRQGPGCAAGRHAPDLGRVEGLSAAAGLARHARPRRNAGRAEPRPAVRCAEPDRLDARRRLRPDAARWARAVSQMDDEYADQAWAMLALGAPDGSGVDLSVRRINAFIDRDNSEGKKRSALLVAGLAGLGRIDEETASRLSGRFGLRVGNRSPWTRMIDRAAALGQSGTVLVLTGTGLQAPTFEEIPPSHVFHAIAALKRTGQEYTARMIAAEALARRDVTFEDRALVDRFLDMMAAEAGASRNTLPPIAPISNGPPKRSAGPGQRRQRGDLEAGRQMERPCAFDRGAAFRGAAALLRLPSWRKASARTIPLPLCRGRRSSGRCPRSWTRTRSRRCSKPPKPAPRAASHLALRNLALLELLYGSGLRATELVSLPRGALRVGQPFLILKGKGSKERLVPISAAPSRQSSAGAEEVPGVVALAVSQRQDASQPDAPLPDRADHGGGRRYPARADQPARPAACLRNASACRAERTFAWSSRCSATPTSRPRKSTRTSTAHG